MLTDADLIDLSTLPCLPLEAKDDLPIDVPELRAYLNRLGIAAKTKTIRNLEAIAYHLGVLEARNIPLEIDPITIAPKTRKKRVAKSCKSKLTGEQISKLREQGMRFEAMAALAGVSKQAVSERMRRYRESQL